MGFGCLVVECLVGLSVVEMAPVVMEDDIEDFSVIGRVVLDLVVDNLVFIEVTLVVEGCVLTLEAVVVLAIVKVAIEFDG